MNRNRSYLASLLCVLSFGLVVATEATAEEFKCPSVSVFLRRDFADMGWFGECSPAMAVGAQATGTYDGLKNRFGVSADGVAAVAFHYYGGESGFLGFTLAPYVQFDGTQLFTSLPMSQQTTDTITPGGFLQFGFGEAPGVLDYFRIRGGEVFGSTGITSNTIVGEWLPVRAGFFHDPQPLGIFQMRFDPEIMVQYDQLVRGPRTYRLFSTNDDSLRVGPQASLLLWVAPTGNIWEPFPGFWEKTFVTLIYHAAVDTYAERNYSWASATITYNLSEHIGLSLSYGTGNSEITGNNTGQIKLGFSGKF
jgi:hypothetical protein